jgi:hypothetical protein
VFHTPCEHGRKAGKPSDASRRAAIDGDLVEACRAGGLAQHHIAGISKNAYALATPR